MKIVKSLFSLIICVLIIALSTGVYAQPVFDAKLSVVPSGKDSDIIYLSYNEEFQVGVHLENGENYYAGPLAFQVFFTKDGMNFDSCELNTKGRLYNCSKSFSSAVGSSQMTQKAKSDFYPESWNTDKRKVYDFCNITMVPNINDSKVSVNSLDEDIAFVKFKAKGKAGDRLKVFITEDSVKTESNIRGKTYYSALTDSGNVMSSRYDFGKDVKLDLTAAEKTFEISPIADADKNETINSSDALLILQYVTGLVPLKESDAAIADVNCDKSLTSADALCALQITVGLARLNDIITK